EPATLAPTGNPQQNQESLLAQVKDGDPSLQATVQPGAGNISHQVSQASSMPPKKDETSVPEPPSPVSIFTDRNIPGVDDTRRMSLAEEKVLIQTSSNPISPTPPPEQHPALAQRTNPHSPTMPLQQATKIMSFKEIFNLPNPTDRIAKY